MLSGGVLLLLLLVLLLFTAVFGPGLVSWAIAVAQYWSHYQLSDAVRHPWEVGGYGRAKARAVFAEPFPESLAAQYLDRVHETPTKAQLSVAFYHNRSFDVALLQHLVARLVHPSNTTLVVHLRIGDTLLNSPKTVDELWTAEKSDLYTRPRAFYNCITPALPNATLSHVVFVASSVHINVQQMWQGSDIARRSERYKALVDAWFGNHLPHARRVWRNQHFAPDHDFAYLASARHLVPGGGGFAAAAATLAERAGGQVYVCNKGGS